MTATAEKNYVLNPESIRRANSASHFDAGDSIDRDAQNALARFDNEFATAGLTDEQKDYLEQRRGEWRQFVLKFYNEYCRRRAEYMPVNVCGPARYPGAKMEKRIERIMALSGEISEKSDRFFANTHKRLKELLPLQNQLDSIRSGASRDPISSGDPHAIEKLKAKCAALEEERDRGKAINKAWRARDRSAALAAIKVTNAEMKSIEELFRICPYEKKPFPTYHFTNMGAEIRRVKQRIDEISKAAGRSSSEIKTEHYALSEDTDENRVMFRFPGKPSEEIRLILKKHAFKWSPSRGAWVRLLTGNAVYYAKEAARLIDEILAKNEKATE